MASGDSHSGLPDVRLVLLGRTGTGTGSVGNIILGKQAFQQGDVKASQKQKAVVAEKQVTVIATPDWYSSASRSADVMRHISSFVTLSVPGPHAFLLCVPVNKPADGEAKALDTMEQLFGPSSVSRRTIVLFTHTDELKEGEKLEEYLSTNRKDLLELVKRCGDRQYILKNQDRGSVEELLQTVVQGWKMSEENFAGSLYEEAEARVKEKQIQIVKQSKAGEKPGEPLKESGQGSISLEEMKKVREAAEKSIHDNLNGNDIPPPIALRAVSIFLSLYGQLAVWMQKLSKLSNVVNREALLETLISLFVGGPLGKILGAAAGSVATEVEKRKVETDK